MAKIGLNSLRKSVSKEVLPGKLIRGKKIFDKYLVVTQLENGYRVCHLKIDDVSSDISVCSSPLIRSLENSLEVYRDEEQELIATTIESEDIWYE